MLLVNYFLTLFIIFFLHFLSFCIILCSMETIDIEQFYERLKQICSNRNITLKALCEQVGINYRTFQNKKFRGLIPTVEELVKMSEHLDVSLDYLLTGSAVELQSCREKLKKIQDIISATSSSILSE